MNRARRVCIVRHRGYPTDVRVRKEARALIDKGYEVDVICLKNENEKSRDTDYGVNIHRIPLQRHRGGLFRYFFEYISFFLVAMAKVSILHFRKRYDFIQVNTLPDFLVFVTVLPKLTGAKVLLDLHEPAPELWGSLFGAHRKWMIAAIKFMEQMAIRYSDRAITVTEELKQTYVERGAPASKISVILNVPNLEFRHEDFQEYYHGNKERFSLICHGLITKRYGQEVAIKAIDRLKNEIPEIHLDILGYGPYQEELRILVSQLNLQDRVHIHGMIPFVDMIKMLAKSDIGIVPVLKNPYSDLVHTNKMFELIAMRKPVVITRTRAVEGFFGSDDSCLKYFESGNERDLARCVLELYQDPRKREIMIRNSYEKFESVRWETMQEEYCKLFA